MPALTIGIIIAKPIRKTPVFCNSFNSAGGNQSHVEQKESQYTVEHSLSKGFQNLPTMFSSQNSNHEATD